MDAPSSAVPRVRRAALAFIFVTVLVDVMAFGLIIPVLPHLLKQITGGEIADATMWHGLFATGYMVMQFFAQPVQGALSDRFGRRPVILVSNAGLAIDFLIMAMANTLPLLFIARLLSGATSASFSTANAYIADVTPPEKRSAAFGRLGMAFGIGFTVAPETGALAKTASGALERQPYLRVTNLSEAMEALKDMGFTLIGLDGEVVSDIARF